MKQYQRCRVRSKAKSKVEKRRSLSDHHYQHLIASGISDEVIKDRGYFTARDKAELRKLGFSSSQAKAVPCLVIPIWGVDGKVVTHQIRPDFPRMDGDKPRKYELPFGEKNHLDIPKRAYLDIKDTTKPLWITEGIKKADAAVSNGLCCIALFGVNNWVTKKEGDTESSPLDDWHKIALTHRRVYICFDSDVMRNPKVSQALRRLKNFLRGKNATVIPIYLPENEGEKVGLDDYFANGGTVEELETLTKRHSTNQDPGGIRPELPTIHIHNKQLAPNVDEAMAALVDANDPPVVFSYSGKLVRLRISETNGIDTPRLEVMNKDMMTERLSRTANYMSISAKGETSKNPPPLFANMILAQDKWPLIPTLKGVVTSPIFSREGNIISNPGYEPETGTIYFEPESLKLPDTVPTKSKVEWAVGYLQNLLADFPFADEASYAHAVAFIVLPFVREMIDGPTPLHVFDAPIAGTGKSLLMCVLAGVFIPRGVYLQPAPKDEEEWRKRLTAMFKEGGSHLLLDNVTELKSESLLLALAARDCLWQDRSLGTNEILLLPIRCVWGATTNNATGNRELLRRCIQIRLDAKTERPEERTGFKHPDIMRWCRDHRRAVLKAVLMIVRYWIERRMPAYSGKNGILGSFESWTQVIGGIIETAGIPGFLDNRKTFTEYSDNDLEALKAFASEWLKVHKSKFVSAKELVPIARQFFDRELGEDSPKSQTIRLGKLLSRYRDQVIGEHTLVIKKTDERSLYGLIPVKPREEGTHFTA